jgi:phosphoribosyl 1,2-cyclic phosphodiesterase
VKHRILSDVGHISNEVCGEAICRFLENQKEEKIPRVFLAHLSKENNTPQQAMLTVGNILEEHDFYVGKNLKMEVLAPEGESQYIVI